MCGGLAAGRSTGRRYQGGDGFAAGRSTGRRYQGGQVVRFTSRGKTLY